MTIFSISGEITLVESKYERIDSAHVLDNIEKLLKNVSASSVIRNIDSITFTNKIFRGVSRTNILGSISAGDLILISKSDEIVITYKLDFDRSIITWIIVGFILFYIFNYAHLSEITTNIPYRWELPVIFPLVVICGNYFLASIRFPFWLEDEFKKLEKLEHDTLAPRDN